MDFPIENIIKIDWDFPGAHTQTLTHKFHSYPARFIPQIPRTIYKIFLKSGGYRIFDPFVGCGTSLIEGILSQNHIGGVDLNPLAILISQVKTRPLDSKLLDDYWKCFRREFLNIKNSISKIQLGTDLEESVHSDNENLTQKFVFPKRNLTKRFTKGNIHVISLILDFIENEIIGTEFQDFFKVGLSSTITTLTESRNWRKVDIWSTFHTKINSMIHIMKKYNQKVVDFSNELQENIKLGDSRKIAFIPDETIDCIVTSPPYVNALDYNRIHQYNMSILGYDYRKFAKGEIGAHGHYISNRWRLLTEYLADIFQSIIEMGRIIKRGSVICIVIGDSCLEYERIKTHVHVRKMGELVGLNHHLSISRNIDTASKSTSIDIGNIFSEHLIFFTKVRELEKISRIIMYEFIEETMQGYLNHVKTSKGSCLRNKPELSKIRQELAFQRVEEALSRIKEDCRFF